MPVTIIRAYAMQTIGVWSRNRSTRKWSLLIPSMLSRVAIRSACTSALPEPK